MAKLEIFENSLLRLLVRRGTNADRLGAVLAPGELGYTTDTRKLYVGDGTTPGGTLIGNTFRGSSNNVTTLTDVSPGDQAYDSDNKTLYRFISGASNNIVNWEVIGGVYSVGDTTLVQSNNTFTVGVVSASNIDPGIVGNSLTFNDGDIALNTEVINTNSVLPYGGTEYLSLPGKLKINNVSYNWPLSIASNLYLTSDVSGNLRWDNLTQSSTLFVPGTAGQIPVGSIMPFASAGSSPSGWLLCNGQTVAAATYPQLYAVIGSTYGGDATNFKVPDLTNKAIYGTASSPGTSTVYSLCARTTNVSTLSATGMLYIIKAVSDPIVSSTISFTGGLSSKLNGVTSTGDIVTALSGNHIVSLPQVTTSQTITGSFEIDTYGRVLNPSPPPPVIPVGNQTPAGSNIAYNATSPIVFLRTPVTFYKHSSEADPLNGFSLAPNTPESFFGTISAYPFITQLPAIAPNISTLSAGIASPSTVIPSNAKNLIIESRVTKFNEVGPTPSYTPRLIVSAPNESLLTVGNPRLVGSTEYTVSYVKGFDGPLPAKPGTPECNVSQVFLPLSASPTGDLVMSFRSPVNFSDAVVLRVVGYTL